MSGLDSPQPNSMAELALGPSGYGGGLQINSHGDLVKVIDMPGNPAATQQRLARIILTNPRLFDAYRNPIGRPDDLFNPDFGSGVRGLIGEPITSTLVAGIQNRILAAIAQDPGIASNPAPTVSVFTDGNNDGLLFVTLNCYTVTGYLVTIPNLPLQINS